ncbi:Bifunctional epoxide hydrolase 2, partial [Melia azedarach]
ENISETGSGSQIEVPVKFIIGSLDPLYNVAKVKDYIENGGMKKHVPSMEEPATILSCVGHYINQEVPDKVNKHIYDFFWPKLDSKDPDLGEFSVETVELNGIKMRYAEEGEGPVILFLHGFPEFWYSWRHQIKYFGSKGFRAVAPDLRGFGGTDAPSKGETDICMYFNIVGDLIQLLEKVAPSEEQVFVVGHDWGAHIAWYLCLLRPDRVKALVNLSVPFTPPDLAVKPLGLLKNIFNSNYHYISRFQEPAKMECEFAKIGIEEVIKRFMANSDPRAIILPPGGEGFRGTITVPPWLSKKVVEYYTRVYEKTGFRGAINNFINLNWKQEILARTYSRSQIKVPVKFIIGELDPILYDVPEIKDYIENGGMKKHVPTMEEPATILDRVGHYVNQEVPHEINEHIYDYFSRMVPGIQIKTAEVNGITMRYAEKGKGPVILFLHGFPEVWYSWRHQINYFASNGFRAVAPDLRGFGDTTVSYDEEEGDESFYTYSNITKDLTGLLDVVAPEQEKVFIVGHDLGAMIAWHLCLVHPERIQACVNLSVAFDAVWRPLADLQNTYGSTYYLCRFQGPKAIDDQFVYEIGVEKVLKKFFQKSALPVRVGEGEGFEELPLPPWLSEKDFKDHYVGKYMKTQFIGGISYYRNM